MKEVCSHRHQYPRANFAATLPGVLGMIGISCSILADTFFVDKGTGSLGLAALNIAIPAYNLMNGLGLMVGVGGATHYSLCRARGVPSRPTARSHTPCFSVCASRCCSCSRGRSASFPCRGCSVRTLKRSI